MGRVSYVHQNLPPRMRKRTKGGRDYYSYDLGGRPRKEISLGTNFLAAVEKWAELERAHGGGYVVAEEKPTFLDLCTRYIKDVLPNKAPRTRQDNLKEMEKLKGFFGNPPAPLDEIRPIHIRQYLDRRTKDGKAHVRANREKALFSHMFNFARSIGMTDAENPVSGVKGFSEKGRSTVYVEDEAFEAVLKEADQPTRFAMKLAYLSGQRPGDVLSATTGDIRDGYLHFEQSKTGKKLRIEITGELHSLISEIQAYRRKKSVIHHYLLITESGSKLTENSLRNRFTKARAAAGVDMKQFQFRDLRAKAATDTTEATGDIRQAQKQLGHANLVMTEHYTRQRKGDSVKPTK
ncbi:MAG TPA: tyrosine-type recombinase/integrase [Limnobacter sp.]|uniref:site-specific integrase n=1 Tax=Limnobacter sp. TaxID=2003368 RepID=UPI002EDAA587